MDQHNFKIPLESFTIYNFKGLELDTTDVPYLLNHQLIYICFEGNKNTKYYKFIINKQ